jgi:hypothetical protein
MLNDAYFAALDDAPRPGRLEQLPVWARLYERELRRLASWWSDHKRIRHHGGCPRVHTPFAGRVSSLPWWAQAWFNTLRFEVYWQREQNGGNEPTLANASHQSRRRINARTQSQAR